MPVLFRYRFAYIYCKWQQNMRIPKPVNRDMVVLLRNDSNKGDQIDNFRPKILLKADYKVLAKVRDYRRLTGR